MFLPSLFHAMDLDPSSRAQVRHYVTMRIPAYDGGNVSVTATMNDGIINSGDIMVHLPDMAFVADQRDMLVIR